jgi:uncharacterized repeat protein (TIGR01451 family)
MKKVFEIVIIVLCLTSVTLSAQTPAGYCTVIQQPCNQDGILQVTITEGLTPPLTFGYFNPTLFYPFLTTTHENVDSYIDICEGLDFIAYVHVSDNYGNYITLQTGFSPPFTSIAFNITDPVCPIETAALLITINDGEMAASADFYGGIQHFFSSSSNPIDILPGEYSVVVYDENGCRLGRDSILIDAPINFNLEIESSPAECTNGTVTVSNIIGGQTPYTYLWSNGATTSSISDLTGGYYHVTVTDNIGCTSSGLKLVTQNPVISVSFTSEEPTCTENNGSITAYGSGGVSPYTYLFNTGAITQTISDISTGTYYVTVVDSNGCRGGNSKSLSATSPITVTYESVNSECNQETGSSELTINGGTMPYSIVWNIYPSQTGTILNGVANGNYYFTVTDSEGCVQNGSVYVGGSDLTASINSFPATCPLANGSVWITAHSPDFPISFLWNTGATTSAISNLSPGYYSCTVADAAGCMKVKSTNVLELSPISISVTTESASCPFSNDGTITVLAFGGLLPYSYQWSNGQTEATASNLLPGNYSVHVTDANGCESNRFITLGYSTVSDDCYCTITGTAYEDLNDNCVFDVGENPIRNIRINCPPYGSIFTDSNGEYSFLLPTGEYTLSETILGYYPLESCQQQSYEISVTAETACIMTYDFAQSVNPIHDIQTQITTVEPAVPGYNYIQKIFVKNAGTITESNIQFGYSNDGQLLFESSSMPELEQENAFLYPDWYGITESFPVLEPGQGLHFYLTYQVPTNIPLATELIFTDTVAYEPPMSNWQSEYSPWNNVVNYSTITIGSFDPNNKDVYPKGLGTSGYIATSDSILTYTVNFENIGSYFARKIVIIDTLDSDLDWNSLQPIYSTHDCVTRISAEGVVSFTFDNIYLPYEGMGRYGSITYSVKQNPELTPGTTILNSAAIYFDFNEPVITNTVRNTISWPESVNQTGINNQVCIYPNPTNTSFSVSGENILSIELLNNLGQSVLMTNSQKDIFIENQPAGIYFVRIVTSEEIVVKKLVKR